MKAVVCEKYGPPEVLKIREVPKPIVKDNEVLVKVFATTANAADARIRGAVFPSIFNLPVKLAMGFKGPRKKILGLEVAGVVESIGKNVTKYHVGDQVFASTGSGFRGYAEYVCLPEKSVMTIKPSNMTFEEAAAVPHCALAAYYYLRKGKVGEGQKVMIYGASGGIGTFAVQIAKAFGAEVTGVCSTANVELVKLLGADKVIDYTKGKITQVDEPFDVIFDTIGKASISDSVELLKEKGMYLSAVHLELSRIFEGIRISVKSSKKVIGGVASYTTENLIFLKNLIEEGKMKTAIDKTFTLEQMAEAHAYVDTGHKKGHVVITVNQEN
ncbi:NAD(P)-dependent alcohol dehydrogenase [Mariniphaga sediminis]|uniref:NAD(P)-dependent alcohol dehydrogenase n=1 Tax=Mariniphaga sediminis TaxID=1628158 RepID=A0A399CZ80_9BACT|nr:NAD(P)-dependent alcohol dehydrogenase [Mariniphaga sediminis]RIH63792.1 NAD(P)-dependent alcohol dehydrogenase [Mariniphaga sediminis]